MPCPLLPTSCHDFDLLPSPPGPLISSPSSAFPQIWVQTPPQLKGEKRNTRFNSECVWHLQRFFPLMETVFYLNKRERVLFSSESVFEKFYVMFPWLSGELSGAKIICAIEQAKKIPKRANIFIHSPCLQRGELYSLYQPPF